MQTKQNVLKIFYYSTKLMFLQTLKRKRNQTSKIKITYFLLKLQLAVVSKHSFLAPWLKELTNYQFPVGKGPPIFWFPKGRISSHLS